MYIYLVHMIYFVWFLNINLNLNYSLIDENYINKGDYLVHQKKKKKGDYLVYSSVLILGIQYGHDLHLFPFCYTREK